MKKFKFYFPLVALLAAAGLFFTSCGDDNGNDTPKPVIVTNPSTTLNLVHAGETKNVTVNITNPTSGTWNAEDATDGNKWFSIDKKDNVLEVTVEQNPGNEERKGTITFTYPGADPKSLAVVQEGIKVEGPKITVSPSQSEIDDLLPLEGTLVFTVSTTPEDLEWTVELTDKSWGSITSKTSKGFIFTYDDNPSSTAGRENEIVVKAEGASSVYREVYQEVGYAPLPALAGTNWTMSGVAIGFPGPDGDIAYPKDTPFSFTSDFGYYLSETGRPFYASRSNNWPGTQFPTVIGYHYDFDAWHLFNTVPTVFGTLDDANKTPVELVLATAGVYYPANSTAVIFPYPNNLIDLIWDEETKSFSFDDTPVEIDTDDYGKISITVTAGVWYGFNSNTGAGIGAFGEPVKDFKMTANDTNAITPANASGASVFTVKDYSKPLPVLKPMTGNFEVVENFRIL